MSASVSSVDDGVGEKRSTRQLQVSVPAGVFRGFSERAAREHDYHGGAKRALFLEVWEAYEGAEFPQIEASEVWGAGEPLRSLYFQLPESMFVAFAQRADRTYDFVVNARARLAVDMWVWYCERKGWNAMA